MFGMTQSQIEASMSTNYVRLLKKAGKYSVLLLIVCKYKTHSRSIETRRKTYNAVVRVPEAKINEDKMNVDTPSLKRKEQPNNNNNNNNNDNGNNNNKKKNKNKKQKR